MANPAFERRKEEVSKDLQALGFSPDQAKVLIRAMTDTIAGLGLLTRSEWQRAQKSNQERFDRLELRMDRLEQRMQKNYERLLLVVGRGFGCVSLVLGLLGIFMWFA